MVFRKDQNTIFTDLTKTEKDTLISEILTTPIEYRTSLGLPKNVTFGVEVEYDKVNKDDVDLFRHSIVPTWTSPEEKSLPKGGELTSSVLRDEAETWKSLKQVCEFLRISGAYESEEVGSHIHVGVANTLGDKVSNWKNLVSLIMAYEKILYRFTNGESNSPRYSYISFCYPIALELYDSILINNMKLETMKEIQRLLPKEKFQSFNFRNVAFDNLLNNNILNTIELRTPNGTYEEIIWQNNINFITRFLLACCKELDKDYINYRIKELSYKYNYNFYKDIDDEGALELADLLFDNELDKVYFLRQYFKNYELSESFSGLDFTKSFIKRG